MLNYPPKLKSLPREAENIPSRNFFRLIPPTFYSFAVVHLTDWKLLFNRGLVQKP